MTTGVCWVSSSAPVNVNVTVRPAYADRLFDA